MDTSLKLGTIWGIPIGVHASWFLVFFLLVWSLSIGYFPEEYPRLSPMVHLILALVTSLLFFASVLGHELGHSFVALKENIPVRSVTLFIFGGVAHIGQEPRSPGAEFRIAIAGPLTSLLFSLLFGAIWLISREVHLLAAPVIYLMRINLILASFNMIPGFPLDGGRVLRAIVWWLTKSFTRATRIASLSGQFIAFGFIAVGVYQIFSGQLMDGLWLAFIGWFLQNAAATTFSQLNMQEALRGVTVSQAMSRDCVEIPSLTPLSQLIEERILSGGQRCFYISDEGQLRGMLTLRDITKVPQPQWRFTTVGEAMVPLSQLIQVNPWTELLAALQLMDNHNIAQVPVIENDQLVGTLTREQVMHYIRLRAELGI